MLAPDDVDVWMVLDVGKDAHFAVILDNDGERLHARAVDNDEADLDALLEVASGHGVAGLVIDQPGSIAQLAIAVATRRVPIAYVPGLVMRRAVDLYPGEAKTDRRDAYVLADTARTRRRRERWRQGGDGDRVGAGRWRLHRRHGATACWRDRPGVRRHAGAVDGGDRAASVQWAAVRQLDRVTRTLLARAWAAGLGPDLDADLMGMTL